MNCRVNIAGGSIFDPLNPNLDMIDPSGILHHLVMLSRWGGNVRFPFNVLQHSLIVAEAIKDPSERIYGLIHDWPEALLGADIISPTKLLLHHDGADVNAHERLFMNLIYRKLSLPAPSTEIARRVHEADMRARATELRDVVANPTGIVCPAPPFNRPIKYENWALTLERGHQMLDAYLWAHSEAA
ncbi:hypothetical protein [Pelagibacterium lentulum]|uniref:Phosphohydrolase n=1 Tax=Pelagibacterium lentulum TaxID=2029865 RepID=A0A916RNE2_9HYPH|nr:hypothetical protein [Pelagibacterium lentulum]GGA63700.1 hypothetical protein GCM10011499_37570 [Pelagibacterium lentulum]